MMRYITKIEEYVEPNWYTILTLILFFIVMIKQNQYLTQFLLGGVVGTQTAKLGISIIRYTERSKK